MKKTIYLFSLLFVITNCKQATESRKSETDEKLLLIAFVNQNFEANKMLGWKIINDIDIINEAKKKYDLEILNINDYKIPNKECALNINETIQKNSSETFFVIANKEQCWFSVWKLSDDKESILEKLGVGNGP